MSNYVGQIKGCRCAVNVTMKTLPDKVGQISKMVHVRMRYYHRIDGFRIEWEIEVTLIGFSPAALEKTAVQ